jgi:hypothetical protein
VGKAFTSHRDLEDKVVSFEKLSTTPTLILLRVLALFAAPVA